jgi:hypothetical protein
VPEVHDALYVPEVHDVLNVPEFYDVPEVHKVSCFSCLAGNRSWLFVIFLSPKILYM